MSAERSFRYRRATTRLSLGQRISRRALLQLAGGIAAGGLTATWLAKGGAEWLKNLAEERTTWEQKKVAEILKSSNQDDLVKNIRVSSQYVNLRDKPRTAYGFDDTRTGQDIGDLKFGEEVTEAKPVLGGNPDNPKELANEGVWYAFFWNGKPVFAYSRYFDPPYAWVEQGVEPIDLSEYN